jgi:hypothetical protein
MIQEIKLLLIILDQLVELDLLHDLLLLSLTLLFKIFATLFLGKLFFILNLMFIKYVENLVAIVEKVQIFCGRYDDIIIC